jgi:hypothetical protein
MLGFEYNWLISSTRSARGLSVRLARGGLFTLAVGAFCVACAVVAPSAGVSSTVTVAAPAAVTISENASAGLPRVLLRLWILAPSLIPQR